MLKSIILMLLMNTYCYCSRTLEIKNHSNVDDQNIMTNARNNSKFNTEYIISEWQDYKKSIAHKVIVNLAVLKETHFQLPKRFRGYKYARKHIKSLNNYYNINELQCIRRKIVNIYYKSALKWNEEHDQGIHSLNKINESSIEKLKDDIESLGTIITACRNQINESIIFTRFIKHMRSKTKQTCVDGVDNKENFSSISQIKPSLIWGILVQNKFLQKRFHCITIDKDT